jgi:hypothetical protein
VESEEWRVERARIRRLARRTLYKKFRVGVKCMCGEGSDVIKCGGGSSVKREE